MQVNCVYLVPSRVVHLHDEGLLEAVKQHRNIDAFEPCLTPVETVFPFQSDVFNDVVTHTRSFFSVYVIAPPGAGKTILATMFAFMCLYLEHPSAMRTMLQTMQPPELKWPVQPLDRDALEETFSALQRPTETRCGNLATVAPLDVSRYAADPLNIDDLLTSGIPVSPPVSPDCSFDWNDSNGAPRPILMLCPTRALVLQQVRNLKRWVDGFRASGCLPLALLKLNFRAKPLLIASACGHDVEALVSPEAWRAILTCDIVVATPQTVVNAMNLQLVTPLQFSALIVDEAHHVGATDAPVNALLEKAAAAANSAGYRPLQACVGLSATPVVRKLPGDSTDAAWRRIQNMIEATSSALSLRRGQSQLCYVRGNAERDLQQYVLVKSSIDAAYEQDNLEMISSSVKPEFISAEPFSESTDATFAALLNCVISSLRASLEQFFAGKMSRPALSVYSKDSLDSLSDDITHVMRNVGFQGIETVLSTTPTILRSKTMCRFAELKVHQSTIRAKMNWISEVARELEYFRDFVLPGAVMNAGFTQSTLLPFFYAHPLIAAADIIAEELRRRENTASYDFFRCIVFVDTISLLYPVARALEGYLRAKQCRSGAECPCSRLHGPPPLCSVAGGSSSMRTATLENELEMFMEKNKIIVATTVLEEGIDMPNCALSISLSPVQTVKQVIQRAGRARQSTSRSVVLNTRKDLYDQAALVERALIDLRADCGRPLLPEATPSSNAKSKLNEFCQRSRLDPLVYNTIGGDSNFQCYVELILHDRRYVGTGHGNRKLDAEKAAAALLLDNINSGNSCDEHFVSAPVEPAPLPPRKSSCETGGKNPKSFLNELCQRSGIPGPIYETEGAAGNFTCFGKFTADRQYTSTGFATRKIEAEKAAATELVRIVAADRPEILTNPSAVLPVPVAATLNGDLVPVSTLKNPKSALNEFCQQNRKEAPDYRCHGHDGEFRCIVKLDLDGVTYSGFGRGTKKVDAEKTAAAQLLHNIERGIVGSVDLSELATPTDDGNSKGRLNCIYQQLCRPTGLVQRECSTPVFTTQAIPGYGLYKSCVTFNYGGQVYSATAKGDRKSLAEQAAAAQLCTVIEPLLLAL